MAHTLARSNMPGYKPHAGHSVHLTDYSYSYVLTLTGEKKSFALLDLLGDQNGSSRSMCTVIAVGCKLPTHLLVGDAVYREVPDNDVLLYHPASQSYICTQSRFLVPAFCPNCGKPASVWFGKPEEVPASHVRPGLQFMVSGGAVECRNITDPFVDVDAWVDERQAEMEKYPAVVEQVMEMLTGDVRFPTRYKMRNTKNGLIIRCGIKNLSYVRCPDCSSILV